MLKFQLKIQFKNIFKIQLKKTIAILIAALFPVTTYACTIFTLNHNGGHYIARSFDWDYGDGVVLVNPRGMNKGSLLFDEELTPIKWVSKYGSVTLNQAADEFPMSGMNEAGLTIDVLVLSKSKFPKKFIKPVLNEVQWIQFLLDTAATVDEAQAQAEKVQISPFAEKVHYMICDAGSNCAVFEYLDGAMVVSRYTRDQKQIIANDKFSETIDYNKMTARPKAAYDHLNTEVGTTAPVEYMLNGLEKVHLSSTQWQMVYSVNDRTISFRNRNQNRTMKIIDLKKMNFECKVSKTYIDIHSQEPGDISGLLSIYPRSRNDELLRQVLPMPDQLMPIVNNFYGTLGCAIPSI